MGGLPFSRPARARAVPSRVRMPIVEAGSQLKPQSARKKPVGDGAGVGNRTGGAVALGTTSVSPCPDRRQRLIQAGTRAAGPRQAMVDIDPLGGHQRPKRHPLRGEVLPVGRAAGMAAEGAGLSSAKPPMGETIIVPVM